MWKYALENEANEFAYKKSFIIRNIQFHFWIYTNTNIHVCVGGQTEKNRKKGTFLNL